MHLDRKPHTSAVANRDRKVLPEIADGGMAQLNPKTVRYSESNEEER
jgi:hypothetical protein